MSLNISSNNISGKIPTGLEDVPRVQQLHLSSNRFHGRISRSLGKLTLLLELKLDNNNLSGNIPPEIGNLHSLATLDPNQNRLESQLPQELGELNSIEKMDLSHNRISGTIPSTFDHCLNLIPIDISCNQFVGPFPNIAAFQKAPFDALKDNKVSIVVRVRSHTKHMENKRREFTRNLFSIWNFDGKMVYENIIEATKNFDPKYCQGIGGFGSVFRAELPNGQILVVKKLHASESVVSSIPKHFANEIRALTNIRHRNIVKLYGLCSHTQHKFLVYEFLDGRSLKELFSNDEIAAQFDWIRRVNIVKDVANALSYIHHDLDHHLRPTMQQVFVQLLKQRPCLESKFSIITIGQLLALELSDF
ncbi:hypothetical protein ACH5RR_026621 [Cinchona calisaya]|uniref:non-specific serine/threonine protein kinase n=1 Tax=Cinchona calisaya TaxID=153742 RepID=A0ABD2Z484_9GENT